MEQLRIGEVVAVSRYLTPNHIDVTDVPVRYAPPKAAWIDGYDKLRSLARIDASDRMMRRRTHSHAIISPEEIPECAFIITRPTVAPAVHRTKLLGGLRDAAGAMFKRRAYR
ncbi:MAG: hypothetical protein ABR591_05865 [Candidatus Velthaea sp.]